MSRTRDARLARRDMDLISDLDAAWIRDANPLAGVSLLLLLAILVAGYLWSSTAYLDEVTRGDGRVISSQREQVVQSLEGGILAELEVREGDLVEQGQVLLRIDDTRFSASLGESQARVQALEASIIRLRAEVRGVGTATFPERLPADLVASERELLRSRRHALDESLAGLRRSLQLAEQELGMTEPLVERGGVSRVEILRLRRQVNDLRAQIRDRSNTFKAEAQSELTEKESELTGLREVQTARADQLRRTVVRAPLKGTVENVRVTTLGGVIQPGAEILTIVPAEDQLLIEARIRPADVAFLRPGLPATVKITAYDYSIYGGMDGTLELISSDTIADESNPKDTFYRIRVRTRRPELEGKDGPLPIIPGMTASVEILTGRKTVLEYLLKPVLKVRDGALKER